MSRNTAALVSNPSCRSFSVTRQQPDVPARWDDLARAASGLASAATETSHWSASAPSSLASLTGPGVSPAPSRCRTNGPSVEPDPRFGDPPPRRPRSPNPSAERTDRGHVGPELRGSGLPALGHDGCSSRSSPTQLVPAGSGEEDEGSHHDADADDHAEHDQWPPLRRLGWLADLDRRALAVLSTRQERDRARLQRRAVLHQRAPPRSPPGRSGRRPRLRPPRPASRRRARSCAPRTARSPSSARITQEMRIDDVEIISMLMPSAAKASNMSAATPVALDPGPNESLAIASSVSNCRRRRRPRCSRARRSRGARRHGDRKLRSVRPSCEMFCTIMSTWIPSAATALKIDAAMPGRSGTSSR